jgi:hypothetical protein
VLAGVTVTTTIDTMDTLANADLLGSATLVATTLTLGGEGATSGAEYTAPKELVARVPQEEPLHPAPLKLHVTPVFDVPFTVAVKESVAAVETDALVGLMLNETAGAATMLTLADADLLGSAMLVATTVTLGGEGATSGAEYTAPMELVARVPYEEPLQPAPIKLHTTAVFDVPFTVAVNESVAAVETEALVGLMLNETTGVTIMLTFAEADLVGSATLVTITCRVSGEGTLDGAV